jgi:hypothetical protein
MKKLLILALFALAFTSTRAKTPYHLNKEGAVADYVTKDAEGKVTSYSRVTATEVNITDDRNYTITTTNESFDADHKPTEKPNSVSVVVRDGVTEMPTRIQNKKITWVKYPSQKDDLSVGQEFDYEFSIKVMGIKVTTIGKEKVTAQENITTPVGTFDCYKIETDMTMRMIGHNQNMKMVEWKSAGVGTIKSETRDPEGELMMTTELISLK